MAICKIPTPVASFGPELITNEAEFTEVPSGSDESDCLSAVLSRQLKPAEIQEREEDKLWTPPEHTQLEQTWPGTNTRRLHVYKHACQHLCSSTLPAT